MRRALATLLFFAACLGFYATASQSSSETLGPHPVLPEPKKRLIPTVNIAPAKGWSGTLTPSTPSPDLQVAAFATGLDHPRWLYVLPNGDVLVAESNAPSKASKGLLSWAMGLVMKRAGAATPSANRISLLRDSDGNGVADLTSVLLEKLNSPLGIALVGDHLYIANTDAIVSFPYKTGDTHITAIGTQLVSLPAGDINHHWTKNIIASRDGNKLYVSVGSNSNIGENGIEVEAERAAIWEVDIATGSHRIFASGLRNPNGMAWEPETGNLWTVVNERDELGDNLVPDYLTSVKDGSFYGWPYSYYGQYLDTRMQPQRPDLVATAIAPDYSLGSHVAPLGLVSAENACLLPGFAKGMFVGMHGSWNRTTLNGYKVAFIPFNKGKPEGMPIDVLVGFVNDKGEALGRPVGVAIDNKGALLVADDVGNIIWRVASKIGGKTNKL